MQSFPSGFDIDLLFPEDYSDFIAEIYYQERLVFVISQESGPGRFDLEFDTDVRGRPPKMSLDDLQFAIEFAKLRLLELQQG